MDPLLPLFMAARHWTVSGATLWTLYCPYSWQHVTGPYLEPLYEPPTSRIHGSTSLDRMWSHFMDPLLPVFMAARHWTVCGATLWTPYCPYSWQHVTGPYVEPHYSSLLQLKIRGNIIFACTFRSPVKSSPELFTTEL